MPYSRTILAALALAACSPAPDGCEPDGDAHALPDDVREASGVAWSRTHSDVVWIHNDSEGGAVIHAFDVSGSPLGTAELDGAHNRDWEDIAIAPCPDGGPDGDCFYVADVGDNRAARDGIGVWVAPEPDPQTNSSAAARFFRMRYPDGPRDAEALVAFPDRSVLIVSKGREHPVSVYRSAPLRWDDAETHAQTLTLSQRLSDGPVDLPLQITGASLARDGRILALRSYSQLQFYRPGGSDSSPDLTPLLPEPVALEGLSEPQGEGVALGPRGALLLVSEAGPQAIAPRLTPLRCRLP